MSTYIVVNYVVKEDGKMGGMAKLMQRIIRQRKIGESKKKCDVV